MKGWGNPIRNDNLRHPDLAMRNPDPRVSARNGGRSPPAALLSSPRATCLPLSTVCRAALPTFCDLTLIWDKMKGRGKRMIPTRDGRDAFSAALQYQLTRSLPLILPCGLPSAVSRAAALAAWVCSLHQTFDWPDSRCAIALVLPRRPSREVGRLGELSLPMIGSPAFPAPQDV